MLDTESRTWFNGGMETPTRKIQARNLGVGDNALIDGTWHLVKRTTLDPDFAYAREIHVHTMAGTRYDLLATAEVEVR